MDKMIVAIVSGKSLTEKDGSTFRPLMQSQGLNTNGFVDFELFDVNSIDDFEEDDFSIIHAHQMSGLLFNNYLADLHGVATRQFKDGVTRHSFLKRKFAELVRLPELEKMEKKLIGNARAIVCAGESIEEFVRPTGKAFLVRNCVDTSKYKCCDYSSARIAVCGPFLRTYQNRYQLDYVIRIAKAFPKLSFLLVGRIEHDDLEILHRLGNIESTGYVEDFAEVLRTCSIMFAPYSSFTSQGGAKTKLIEAAACGMCIVATPYAVCDFFAENVKVAEDAMSLAKHLQYFAESEDVRKAVGHSMKRYVSTNHCYLTETKKLIKIYEEFCN